VRCAQILQTKEVKCQQKYCVLNVDYSEWEKILWHIVHFNLVSKVIGYLILFHNTNVESKNNQKNTIF
jgi:mannosyltransferase OCH1-like enzyme